MFKNFFLRKPTWRVLVRLRTTRDNNSIVCEIAKTTAYYGAKPPTYKSPYDIITIRALGPFQDEASANAYISSF
jgi:hypothetical protein